MTRRLAGGAGNGRDPGTTVLFRYVPVLGDAPPDDDQVIPLLAPGLYGACQATGKMATMSNWWDTAAPLVGVVLGAQLTMMNERRRERRHARVAALRLISLVDASPNVMALTDEKLVEIRVAFADAEIRPDVWEAAMGAIQSCKDFYDLPENRDDPWNTRHWGNVPLIAISHTLPDLLQDEVLHPQRARWLRRKRLRTLNDSSRDLRAEIESSLRQKGTSSGGG